jgi:hypothetical protein
MGILTLQKTELRNAGLKSSEQQPEKERTEATSSYDKADKPREG